MRLIGLRFASAFTLVIFSAVPARATDCQELLHSFFNDLRPDHSYSSILVTMITLNGLNTASYTETRLYYETPERMPCKEPNFYPPRTILGFDLLNLGLKTKGKCVPRYMRLPADEIGSATEDSAKFDFGGNVQVFSDRLNLDIPSPGGIGLPHRGVQKFDERQADSLDIEITDSKPVVVRQTLRSWGDVKVTYAPSCHSDGFMTGQAKGTWYIMRLNKWGERH